jgi:CRISPR-associated endonuclease/helicase Cas3
VHLAERLETETYRAFALLTARAVAVMKAIRRSRDVGEPQQLRERSPALIVLGRDRQPELALSIEDLARRAELKGNQKQQAEADLSGRTVVVNARLGGLNGEGMLQAGCEHAPDTLDAGWDEPILTEIGYRILGPDETEPDPTGWRRAQTIALATPEASESGDERPLQVFVARGEGAARAGDPAIARQAQSLQEHHEWAGVEAERMADALGLPQAYREALVAAARHHDAGKDRELWQGAMNARQEGRPYAKTEGGGDNRRLGRYRHEFGTLRDLETCEAFARLDDERRELALHLIAAHHGHARPIIASYDPGRPGHWETRSAQEARAREVALRFARLQRRFGPWGLAWLEALLRAADWRASARLDTQEQRADRPAEAAE